MTSRCEHSTRLMTTEVYMAAVRSVELFAGRADGQLECVETRHVRNVNNALVCGGTGACHGSLVYTLNVHPSVNSTNTTTVSHGPCTRCMHRYHSHGTSIPHSLSTRRSIIRPTGTASF